MKVIMVIAVCLFSSLAMAKSVSINEPVSSSVQETLINLDGRCVSILGDKNDINTLLAQGWLKDIDGLCVKSVLENSNGDCVESINQADTTRLLEQGYAKLDVNSCN